MQLKNRDSGQVALILVLIMTVIGSAAVALSGRTTVETRVQEISIDSSQAQIAAESGLEQALRNAPTGPLAGDLNSNTRFKVGDTVLPAENSIYKGIKRGETVEIYLAGATATSVNVHWTPTGDDPSFVNRGLFVTDVRPTGLIDYAFDTQGVAGSGFVDVAEGSGSSYGFEYSANVPINPTTTALRVTALGGDIDVGFTPVAGSIPNQLRDKPSVGTVTYGVGPDEEKVQYGMDLRISINGEVPEVFEYALFSGQSISQ